MAMTLEISELKKRDEMNWDKYVHKSNSTTFFHQIGWKHITEETYGHRPYYLLAKENDMIRGILPSFLMKSKIFGKKIVSVPFAPYGGICADNKLIESALFEEVKKITKNCKADYLELRNMSNQSSNLIKRPLQVTSILDLDPNPEVIWESIKRDKRRGIKKSNLEVMFDSGDINAFYDIYAKTMWNLGSPVHSVNFFKYLVKEFPEKINILLVKHEDKAIVAIFLLFFKDMAISGWSGFDRKYQKYHPNDIAYWNIIKECCKNGYRYLDFGKSMPNSGVHKFKESFGAKTKCLQYQYYLNNTDKVPNLTVSNSKRQVFAKIWKKVPISIANSIGPKIRKSF